LTNRVREQGEWGRLKARSLTLARRKAYEVQHRAIVEALRDRDARTATKALTEHLDQIQHNLFSFARVCFRWASSHVQGFPKRGPMQKSSSSMGYGNKTARKVLPKMLRINTVTTTGSHTGA
jgi:hypothetical protein